MTKQRQKTRNEDFLKELDKDRNEKNCEYAILVSLLEPESELYNSGIVDVSRRYQKMYVVRPQFFIPIITLLRNAVQNSLKYKTELAIVKSQSIDITNFEDEVCAWRESRIFGCNARVTPSGKACLYVSRQACGVSDAHVLKSIQEVCLVKAFM